MAEKRKRGQNFIVDEKDKLVKLLLRHKNTLLNKKTDGTTNEAKNSAWIEVTEMFNSSATIPRSKESLMKAWEKMKSESKIYYSQTKRSCTQTGGGVAEVKFNPILEQVCVILGRGCTGIIGVPDSDADSSSQEPEMVDTIESMETEEVVLHIVQDTKPKENVNDPVFPGPSSCQLDSQVHFGESSLEGKFENPSQSTPERLNERGTIIKNTPLWSRRRPQQQAQNERTEAVSSLCDSFKDVNKKKADIEDLKRQLLLDEIEHKRKLYAIQLQAAETDLKIKEEELKIKELVLKQVQGTGAQLLTRNGNPSKNN